MESNKYIAYGVYMEEAGRESGDIVEPGLCHALGFLKAYAGPLAIFIQKADAEQHMAKFKHDFPAAQYSVREVVVDVR